MTVLYFILAALIGAAVAWALLRRARAARRRALLAKPLPPAWRAVVERNLPLYSRLTADERRELEGRVQIFLAEKRFEGCGGLEMTDEIRVTIAAHACLLILRLDPAAYSGLSSILVYPSTYVAPHHERIAAGIGIEGTQARWGESWTRGAVVLVWDEVRRGASDMRDGENVVLHEFAHQLDGKDGAPDGTPPLPNRSRYLSWARTFGKEFSRLRREAAAGAATVLDPYGATDEAEFFAVATEAFFERPLDLKRRHSRLYQELSAFYGQDPAARA